MYRLLVPLVALLAGPVSAETAIVVQSTTSTANSGLYDHLLPLFETATGITVNVVAVGTGQAIKNAENCDGDVLLVHSTAAEERFVAAGFGVARHDLMFNDFVIVGPDGDPAGIADAPDVATALRRIAGAQAPFVSRGDDSGTHVRELDLWDAAGVGAAAASGQWYRETGSGMGATLNVAIGMAGYALTDRATWVSFGNRQDFRILVEGDPALFNQYGVILVSPDHCPDVKAEAGQAFVAWLLSTAGQDAIDAFAVGGQTLFTANAAGRD